MKSAGCSMNWRRLSVKTIEEVIAYLQQFQKQIKIMEVCGTHTASIVKNGIRELLPDSIRLVSGPGCPVCVTPVSYIDRLVELAFMKGHTVLSYGDLFKVKGSEYSLSTAKAAGADVRMVYSPLEAIRLAKENPECHYVVTAVGFETTAPVYALLLQQAEAEQLDNIRLAASLKTMPAVMDYVCRQEELDGFLCPGHVCSVTGIGAFKDLCERYRKPFVISGFSAEHILCSIYEIVRQISRQKPAVKNFYPSAVKGEGNLKAQELMKKYFQPVDAVWRGIGTIPESGLALRSRWEKYDAGSGAEQAESMPAGCACGDVIMGRIHPTGCHRFGKGCTPDNAMGPCMVSAEGACGIWYENGTEDLAGTGSSG